MGKFWHVSGWQLAGTTKHNFHLLFPQPNSRNQKAWRMYSDSPADLLQTLLLQARSLDSKDSPEHAESREFTVFNDWILPSGKLT